MHIPESVTLALQDRVLHKKLNYRQGSKFWGPGGSAKARAKSWVECLTLAICLSFSLPFRATRKHGRHLRELSLAGMSRETESKQM